MQDIHQQRIISIYEIINGGITGKSFTESQYLFDSLGRCHTEIDFDTTRTIQGFRWNYFLGDKLIVKQTYVKDMLVKVDSFVYNDALIKRHYITLRVGNKLETIVEDYTYLRQSLVSKIQAKYVNTKGVAYVVRYTYDTQGTELQRKVKVKKSLPSDSTILLNRIPVYDSLGRVISEVVEKYYQNKSVVYEKTSYVYDKFGQVVGKSVFDKSGNLIFRFEYIYKGAKILWQEKVYNGNGVLIKMKAWRIEDIVRGSNRRISSPGM